MSEQNASAIIDKVWGLCNVLRDDGVSYGDYLEQLTYLIFIKMADEYSKPPYNRSLGVPAKYSWNKLSSLAGAEMEEQYNETLKNWASLREHLVIFLPKRRTESAIPHTLNVLSP